MSKNAKQYLYQDGVFSFEGSISLQKEGEYVSPWRIDYEHLDFYPFLKDGVPHACSGVRLSFTTNSENISLQIGDHEEGFRTDLFVNDILAEKNSLSRGCNQVTFKALSSEYKRIDIWIDQSKYIFLKALIIDEEAEIFKTVINKKRWVHYGSSISHCNEGSSPSNIWTSLVAQKLDLHLTNLGFAGNCKIEPMMGLLISKLPADFITLKLGINVDLGELTPRTFGPNVIGLIQIIREKHPLTPLAIISPIYSPPREGKRVDENHLGLIEMRNIMADIVESCRKYGDENIYYVDGLKILGEKELIYLPDGLHPNAEGQAVLAENFVKEVFSKLL